MNAGSDNRTCDRTRGTKTTKRDMQQRLRVRRDAFLGGAVVLDQPVSGYRAGLDAVLLASAVTEAQTPADRPWRVADVGAGVGTIGMCLARRCPTAQICLIEQDASLAKIAAGNIELNGFAARARVVKHNVFAKGLPVALVENAFDHVVANPPFFDARTHRAPSDLRKAAAHIMPYGGLEGWLRFCVRVLKPGGQATLIYPASQLAQLLTMTSGRLGALRIKPVHPRAAEPANRVLLQGTKGNRGPLVLLPPLVVHNHDGAMAGDVKRLCAGPHALNW